ncbi:MAG: S-methyl-5'-thioadenosine phosphorylase, partial [Candidatus Omnitrophica bacterium]|nr:S-methyl-5'-thioadenosine phosphorylase [Candidatus Omnitrophota bacterium]
NLLKNVENAKKIIAQVIENIPARRDCACKDALKHAIVTDKKFIPAKVKKDLDIIIGKYVS